MSLESILEAFKAKSAGTQKVPAVPLSMPKTAPTKSAVGVGALERIDAMELQRSKVDVRQDTAEVRRICALPVVPLPDAEEVEEFCRRRVLAGAFDDGFRLRDVQVGAIKAYETVGGGLLPIGVGWGKTLISIMVAESAYRTGVQRVLLLVPSGVYRQLVDYDIGWARRRVPVTIPFHYVGGLSNEKRRALTRAGKKGCYVVPYSYLSVTDSVDMLASIKPGLVICDEAQLLRHRSSARTRRLMECLSEHRPQLVALSGTITSKSIMDYHHLATYALGENSPIPLSTTMATEWGAVIDAEANPSAGQMAGPIRPLLLWAKQHFPEVGLKDTRADFRRAFRLRLTSAPGVVGTSDHELGTSLVLVNRPQFYADSEAKEAELLAPFEGGKELFDLIDKVRKDWVTPNGDELEYAIHAFKWQLELSSGFYNSLSWPDPGTLARRAALREVEAEARLQRAKEHHEFHQEFSRKLRKWLENRARAGLDTPLLVASDMARNGDRHVGAELHKAWQEMKAADFEGRPERDSRAVRVCSYKIDAMLKWAKELKGQGGIVWAFHQEMVRWAYEALVAAGIDALHCPAGPSHDRAILDPANKDKVVVASMSAHGTGKNLQHFEQTCVLQWPRSATLAEQVLGRQHRQGQKADELDVVTLNATRFDQMVFSACVHEALYIHTTTGNKQKVIFCAYDPTPRMFSDELLTERGMQPSRLSPQQRQALEERFGKAETVA